MNRYRALLAEQVKIITGDTHETLRPLAEWEPIFEQARVQVFANVAELAPDVAKSARHAVKRGRKRRSRELRHNERAHLKKLGIGFRNFDDAVILAESVNRDIFTSFARWIGGDSKDELAASVTGIPQVVGGPIVRALTFLGLHARGCTLASETILLAQRGFIEGAHSRARSLYELATIITFLSIKDCHPFELTERYSLSGLVERRREIQGTEEEDPFSDTPGLEEAMRNRWGDSFFKPYGWAISGVGDGTAKQVTFRDIESSTGLEHLRHAYLTMNHSVHAGAAAMINRFDGRHPFRNRIGSEVDYHDAAWVTAAAAYFFRGIQIPMVLEIAPLVGVEMELVLGPLDNLCQATESFFNEFIENNEPSPR